MKETLYAGPIQEYCNNSSQRLLPKTKGIRIIYRNRYSDCKLIKSIKEISIMNARFSHPLDDANSIKDISLRYYKLY